MEGLHTNTYLLFGVYLGSTGVLMSTIPVLMILDFLHSYLGALM